MPRVLTITAADRERLDRLAAQSGTAGHLSGFVARERDEEIGWLLTEAAENDVRLLRADAQGEAVLEGLVRTALFAAYDQGAVWACCRAPELFPLLERLCFDRHGEEMRVSLPEFCHRPCRHGKARS